MSLTWVNHASYIIEHGSIKLICDPWIEGRVFNQSWALLAPSKFEFEDFSTITHIWFSHEHPDHFFPPNIKKIPAEYRKNITVVFQKTIDKRVLEFCKKMNFKELVELKDYNSYALASDFKITIGKVKNDTDSWMMMDVGEKKILNLNDCILEEDERGELAKYTGKVDLLLTQFSFASWVGNKSDAQAIRAAASEKLEEVKLYITTFQPSFTIPFASYVWFCHQDNFHLNTYANRVDDVVELINQNDSQAIVLYPGDSWDIGDATHKNDAAIKQYLKHLGELEKQQLTQPTSITIEELKSIASEYRSRCLSKNNKLKLKTYAPFSAYLTDLGLACSISYKKGIRFDTSLQANNTDIALHSQSLAFCLQNEYGFDTILIAGTFEKPIFGNFNLFMEYEWISSLNNQGKRMDGIFKRIIKRVI